MDIMSVSKEKIKKEISRLSVEAENIANERVEIDNRRVEINRRITQIVGAISALNELLMEKKDDTSE